MVEIISMESNQLHEQEGLPTLMKLVVVIQLLYNLGEITSLCLSFLI